MMGFPLSPGRRKTAPEELEKWNFKFKLGGGPPPPLSTFPLYLHPFRPRKDREDGNFVGGQLRHCSMLGCWVFHEELRLSLSCLLLFLPVGRHIFFQKGILPRTYETAGGREEQKFFSLLWKKDRGKGKEEEKEALAKVFFRFFFAFPFEGKFRATHDRWIGLPSSSSSSVPPFSISPSLLPKNRPSWHQVSDTL